MRKNILTAVMSGFLVLGGSFVLAEDSRPSGELSAKLQTEVEPKLTAPTFEERLNLKPLSDEELGKITAGGVGPIVYMLPFWVFSPNPLHLHIGNSKSQIGTGGFTVQTNHNFSSTSFSP